jgi:hypothetical protein
MLIPGHFVAKVSVLTFCRMCGSELDAGERYCHHCGVRIDTRTDAHDHGSSRPRNFTLPGLWTKLSPTILLTILIVFAAYIIGQYVAHTEVATELTTLATRDVIYRSMVLSELRFQPAAYYSITDHLYRQFYSAEGALFTNDFPLIFYVWLLAPSIEGIKWLYLPFAVAGTIASYVAVYAFTKQSLIAFLSGAWTAYFLETSHYLMLEYWAISIFLIGLAFFAMKHDVLAAMMIGVAILLKEVFAPFLLVASIYYLATGWRKAQSSSYHFAAHKHVIAEVKRLAADQSMRKAFVWILSTCVVLSIWYVNALMSTAGNVHLSHSPFTTNQPRFRPEALTLLFAAGCCYDHVLPPIPVIIVIGLALVGIGFIERDHKIIMYASFVMFPVLILFGVLGYGSGFGEEYTFYNVPRWDALSITVVNLFWLVGLYKVGQYFYHEARILISGHR